MFIPFGMCDPEFIAAIAATTAGVYPTSQPAKKVGESSMNSNNMIVALITGLAALLTTPSTEADRIVKLKADLGKTLEDLKADEALSNITASFANAATAANPPSREDVTSASRLGEVKAPKPQAPEEQPSESPEGSPPVPLSDPTFKEGPGDEEEPQE